MAKNALDADNPALIKVLANAVPNFASLSSIEQLSGGASQETYKVTVALSGAAEPTRKLALRRSPSGAILEPSSEHPGLEVEANLLKAALDAGVPEPAVLAVLNPEDGLGQGILMEWLEGEALGSRIVRSSEFDEIRPTLAESCGRILAQIHSIDPVTTGLDQQLSILTPHDCVKSTYDIYAMLNSPQPMIEFTAQWLLANLPETTEPALVHNDFRNGNLMIDKTGIVAVLDWELAHLGDPMRDLGWLCVNSWRFGKRELPVGGFGLREDLFAGYEAQSGTKVDPDRVLFWEVFGSFWWAVTSLAMGHFGTDAASISVERPAIGRRSSECQIDCVNLLIPGQFEPASQTEAINRTGESPTTDQLLSSVISFLRADIAKTTKSDISGRTRFMATVASNSLAIVQRDQTQGPAARGHERARLAPILDGFDTDQELVELRRELCRRLASGDLALDDQALQTHLRCTVVDQVRIDQPKYSGLRAG